MFFPPANCSKSFHYPTQRNFLFFLSVDPRIPKCKTTQKQKSKQNKKTNNRHKMFKQDKTLAHKKKRMQMKSLTPKVDTIAIGSC